MPKRKRGVQEEGTHEEIQSRREKEGREKYHHAGLETIRSLKRAAHLELAKLARRIKASRETDNATDVTRLQSEVAAVKELEFEALGRYYLRDRIIKLNKPLAAALHLENTEVAPHRDESDATKNVVARLFNSAAVKTSISASIASLCRVAQIENQIVISASSKRRTADKMVEHGGDEDLELIPRFIEQDITPNLTHLDGADPDSNPSGSEDEENAVADDEDSDETEVDEGAEEEDEDEDEQEEYQTQPEAGPIPTTKTPRNQKDTKSNPIQRPAKTDGTKSSTFLPALSSGYIPAYDSDLSDGDPDAELTGIHTLSQKRPRKNKRGQRARQKIWEAKYGKNANHVVRDKETREREFMERVARRAEKAKKDGTGGGEGGTGGNEVPLGNRRERRTGPEHPSWEAKKAMKDKEKVAFQGTKIVF